MKEDCEILQQFMPRICLNSKKLLSQLSPLRDHRSCNDHQELCSIHLSVILNHQLWQA